MSYKATVWFVVIAAIVFIAFVFENGLAEDRAWEAFKAEHHCQVAGKTEASWGYGAKSMVYVPGQTLWHCDDGQLHGRTE